MVTLTSPQIMQETALRWKREQLITLVPTMGCLHDGHLALVKRAQAFGGKTVVSIFVNPLQFGPNEDLEKYPRPFEDDQEKLDNLGVDCLFAPSVREFYPEGFQTKVITGPLTQSLCGASRPGFFNGVGTVCLKLFLATAADVAIFGEKDFQQLRVIQRMVEDFHLALQIVPHALVREADGLAMSSRNRYLSAEERQWAAMIPRALEVANREISPSSSVGHILSKVRAQLQAAPLQIDYVSIASEQDLVPREETATLADLKAPRLFLAVKCGATRLIDNLALYGT